MGEIGPADCGVRSGHPPNLCLVKAVAGARNHRQTTPRNTRSGEFAFAAPAALRRRAQRQDPAEISVYDGRDAAFGRGRDDAVHQATQTLRRFGPMRCRLKCALQLCHLRAVKSRHVGVQWNHRRGGPATSRSASTTALRASNSVKRADRAGGWCGTRRLARTSQWDRTVAWRNRLRTEDMLIRTPSPVRFFVARLTAHRGRGSDWRLASQARDFADKAGKI